MVAKMAPARAVLDRPFGRFWMERREIGFVAVIDLRLGSLGDDELVVLKHLAFIIAIVVAIVAAIDYFCFFLILCGASFGLICFDGSGIMQRWD